MKHIDLPNEQRKEIVDAYYADIDKQRKKALMWSDWREQNIKEIWVDPYPDGPVMRYGNLNGDKRYPLSLLLTGSLIHGFSIGSTGSGKSVATNFKYHDLLYRMSPKHLELFMIDAKRVEFSKYAQEYKLPHAKVVAATSDMEYVISLGEWFVAQMNERNNMMANKGCSTVTDWYELTGERLPTRILLIDEMGEFLANCTNKQMERYQKILSAVARLGRNTQYFLDFATQLVPPQLDKAILSNFGVKFCLRVNDPRVGELAIGNDAAYYIKQKGFGYLNVGDGTKATNQLVRIPFISDKQFQENMKEMNELAVQHGIPITMYYYNDKQVLPWNDGWQEEIKDSPNKFLLGHAGQYVHEQWYRDFEWGTSNAANILCFSPQPKAQDAMERALINNLKYKLDNNHSLYVMSSNFSLTEKFEDIHSKVTNYEITNDAVNSETFAKLSQLLEARKLIKSVSNQMLVQRETVESMTIDKFAMYCEKSRNKSLIPKPLYENGKRTEQFELELAPMFKNIDKLVDKKFTLSPIYLFCLGAESIGGLGLSMSKSDPFTRFLLEAGNYGIRIIISASQIAEGKTLYKKVCKYKMVSRLSANLSDQLEIQKGESLMPTIGMIEDSQTNERYMFKLLPIDGEKQEAEDEDAA